jgi:hypothetical protein
VLHVCTRGGRQERVDDLHPRPTGARVAYHHHLARRLGASHSSDGACQRVCGMAIEGERGTVSCKIIQLGGTLGTAPRCEHTEKGKTDEPRGSPDTQCAWR